jgi:hypothetical protein
MLYINFKISKSMKKIYFSLLVFFFSASVFAGGWFQDFSSEVIDIIDESDATTPPIDADWYFTGTTSTNFLGQKSVQTVWKNSTSWNLGTDSKPAGKFVYLNGTSGFLNGVAEFSLVSPAFTPVENASDLYYRIQEVKVKTDGEADGAEELYLEVATKVEGVWTWAASTDNVLAGLTGHNVSTTPITILQKSLSDKVGQEIKIRFRGKVDAGNFVAVIYGVALVDNAVTDLSVSTSQNVSSQVPQKHANQVLNALVQNAGKPIAADVATVTATVTGYTATASVPALNPLETSAIAFATPFVPSFGNYQLRYVLSATGQAVNDTAFSNTFTITPNTFAADTGYVQGTAGSTTLDLGNKFTLAVEDNIESISVAWGKLSSDPTSSDFQLVIYALNADIVLGTEPVYVSGTFTRPDNATTLPNNRLATFESYPINKKLSAGDYVFAVRSTVNIGVGTNYDNNSVYHRIDRTNRQLTKTTGQYLLIRVNTASDITLAPAIGSKTAGINDTIFIEGTGITGISGTPAITVKKADDTDVTNIVASFADGKVKIAHDAFEYKTAYTVTVPAGAIEGYASELTWSFTTVGPLKAGLFAPANNTPNVALKAPVSVIFDRAIPEGSTLEGITIATDSTPPVAVSGVSTTKNGAILTIAHGDFANSTKYKVTVPAAAINELAADTSWVFTTVPPVGLATTAPFSPARDAVNVSVTQATVWVNFNQPIDTVSTAGITINGTPVTTVTLASNSGTAKSRVTISTAGLTPFTEGTLYTVVIPAGAIAGYSEEITWSFTTFLTLAPVTFTPAKGAQTASVNTEISIEFNKNFNIQEYGQGTISITSAGGTALSGVTFAKDTENPKKLIISHTDPLLWGTEYTVNVPDNVVASYGGVSDWSFTTESAPEILSFTPADGAVDVAVLNVVEVTFNQTIDTANIAGITINDVAPTSVTLLSREGTKNNVLRLNHAPFTQGTEYTVRIPAGSVLGYDRDTSWTFTTVSVLTYTTSPTDNATDVALDAPLQIEFNRAPLRSRRPSGSIEINGNNGESITVNGTSWNEAGNTVTIDHAPFDPNVIYTVKVPVGLIIDVSEISETTITWLFTTLQGSGLQEIKNAIGVYPTLTKGNITVVSEPGSLIKVVDIAGVVRATYRSVGKQSPIHLDGADGLYIVVVENGKSTLTYKVILQK